MPLRSSIKRVLIIGQETGPFAKLIREIFPNIAIGSVDVLGNLDTRDSVDLAFSVLKQTSGESIERKMHRTIIDLLFELTLTMLEEVEYDLLIPLTPFNSNPRYLQIFSKKIDLPIVDWKNWEKTNSSWKFLSHLVNLDSNSSLHRNYLEPGELQGKQGDTGLFVTKEGIFPFKRKGDLSKYSTLKEQGFFLPIREIHCAAFYSSEESTINIGFQTTKSPFNHAFYYNEIERNAYIPFNPAKTPPIERITEDLFKIIEKVQFMGYFTLFFGINEGNVIPLSHNSIPDEKISLWNKKTGNKLVPLLIDPSNFSLSEKSETVFGYNYPIFTSHPLKVPEIPKEVAVQRNLPGVINTAEYPVCTIQSYSNDVSHLFHKKELHLKQINKILG